MATDATLRIKNLSISLEALSRINNEGSPDLYDRIEALLSKEINELYKEQEERDRPAPPARPTIPDDDIPF